jgi:DNA-binding transcriptional MerR regulator
MPSAPLSILATPEMCSGETIFAFRCGRKNRPETERFVTASAKRNRASAPRFGTLAYRTPFSACANTFQPDAVPAKCGIHAAYAVSAMCWKRSSGSTPMPNGYRIGEIAAKAGVTPDTLRYYERLGVLPPARRTSGGLRLYGDDVPSRVRFIQQAQSLGLTLKDVRQLVAEQGRRGRDRCRKVRDLLALRLTEVDTRLSELRAFRRTLQTHLEACEHALESDQPACPVIEALAGDRQ